MAVYNIAQFYGSSVANYEQMHSTGGNPVFLMYLYNVEEVDRHEVHTIENIKRLLTDTIALPAPSAGISINEQHDWSDEAGLAGSITEALLGQGVQWIKDVGGGLTARLFDKRVTNDMKSLLYNGAELRTFDFSWELIPRSRQELDTIKEIVKKIRLAAMPAGAITAAAWDPPFLFRTEIRSPKAGALFFSDYCGITNIKYDMTGDDSAFNVFHDGQPIKYKLTLSFKELFRQTRDTIYDKTLEPNNDYNSRDTSNKNELERARASVGGIELGREFE